MTLLACALLIACSTPAARVRPGAWPEAEAAARADTHSLCREIVRNPRAPTADAALAVLLERWVAHRDRDAMRGDGCRLHFDTAAPGSYAPEYFDALTPAAGYAVTDLPHYRQPGVGVPLLGLRENRHREAIEQHYPPEAITRPVTALADAVRLPDGASALRVRLLSPLYHETAPVDGAEQPLAADFSVPWAALQQRAGPLRGSWLMGLLNPQPAREPQLYLLEPYDPRKTPLLMIHGLLATPIDWAALTNALWAAPAVRRRYQIWQYHYPTSAPFLYSAKLMRQRLDDVRRRLADAGHGEIRPLVVIGHSMGGLLTKTLITDSGEAAWNTVFTQPVSALRGDPRDLAIVDDILHWRARSHVRRVIFVAVPHRGSELAEQLLGRLGAALAGIPPEFAALYARIDRDNPGALAPTFRSSLASGGLTSVDTLSPRHPMLPVLNALPVAPWVTVHSIIGDRGEPGSRRESSDGVVAYTSSHLARAISELMVPAGHRAFEHPAALTEIERILAMP